MFTYSLRLKQGYQSLFSIHIAPQIYSKTLCQKRCRWLLLGKFRNSLVAKLTVHGYSVHCFGLYISYTLIVEVNNGIK